MGYSVKEASELLGISPRAVQAKCKAAGLGKVGRTYLISSEVMEGWLSPVLSEVGEVANEARRSSGVFLREDNEENEVDTFGVRMEEDGYYLEHPDSGTVTITLTRGKYEELQRLVTDFYHMEQTAEEGKQIVRQLQSMLEEKNRLLEKALDTVRDSVVAFQQQQYIEAKDKGYDK